MLVFKDYGNTESVLGTPMRDEAAKLVEQLIGGHEVALEGDRFTLSEECRALGLMRRSTETTASTTSEEERTEVSLITTASVDRDREVLLPDGLNWREYRKNPVVTFAHRYDQLPVGRALWLKREKNERHDGWLAKTRYSTKPPGWGDHPWLPDAVWHLVRSRELPGKSVGFIALEYRKPTDHELKARPEWERVRGIIPRALMLEYAVAPVPSNPDAVCLSLATLRAKGVEIPELVLESMGLIFPEALPEVPKMVPMFREAELHQRVADLLKQVDFAGMVREVFDEIRGRV